MIESAELQAALNTLEIPKGVPIIAHASLSSFGYLKGGAEGLVRALVDRCGKVLMPSFTYKTMVTPECGPANNGMTYGQHRDANQMAQIFDPLMGVDRLMGAVPEAMRRHERARRSVHPILSFVGIGADAILDSQTLQEPLKPIRLMLEERGWVMLLGVDHDVNTSIHYAEGLSGRKQFVRWALTVDGVVECSKFPGCSDGFPALAPSLEAITCQVRLGLGRIQAIPLEGLVVAAERKIREDSLALLCDRSYCERCEAVRKSLADAHGEMCV